MEGMGLKFMSVVVRRLFGPLSVFRSIRLAVLGFIASLNSPNGGFNPLPTVHPPPPPTSPPLTHLFIHASCDITWL